MRQLGQPVPFRLGLPIWLGSQLGKYLPGKVWSVIGRVYLGDRIGLDAVRVSVSLVIEIGLNLVTGLILAALTLGIGDTLSRDMRLLMLIAVPIGIVALHPRVFLPLLNMAMRIARRGDAPFRWSGRSHLQMIALYAVSWVVYGGAIYLLIDSLALPMSSAPAGVPARVAYIVGANALAWAIGFLAFLTPGGLGVREAGFAYFLNLWVGASAAALLAIIVRVWNTLFETAIIGASWWIGRGARR
jgi:uncharacterized membrane protein YbhN (UPF0104 family)